MKKILITLAALLIASTAFAECALYAEDFEVKKSELGTEIVVPVKAHFSARLNAWQLSLTLPYGLQAVDATAGADQGVICYNSQGMHGRKWPDFYGLSSKNRMIAIFVDQGYWQDPNAEDPEAWTPYGQIKWEGGDYDEMVLLHLLPSVNFKGGDICFNTIASSTLDSRGGTILENGDENIHYSRICHVTVERDSTDSDLYEVDAPVISTTMDKNNVYVHIDWPVSTGQHVYTGKYVYPRGEEDADYEVEAYVTAHHHCAESAHAVTTIHVPAKVVTPIPEDPQIVFIDAHGIEHSYALIPDPYPDPMGNLFYSFMFTLNQGLWGENIPFYFTANGKRYGAETDMQLPEMMETDESVLNPVIESNNLFYVPADYTYTFGLEFKGDKIYLLVAQGVVNGEYTTEKTADPIFYGYVEDGDSYIAAYYVDISPAEPSTIYYRVQYPDETWSEWIEYECTLCFEEEGNYCVEAYAVANGKLPSDELQYWFVIGSYTDISINVNEVIDGKQVAGVRYFNMAGQEMPEANGMTIVVTTYTDGTTSAAKVMK